MLNLEEIASWCERLNISGQARSVLDRVRSSGPARRVGGGRTNVIGRYPSRKMGVAIQFESHRVELAAIYEMEHDEETLEYYDQPPPIELDYLSAAGRRVGVLHTPDFFVIRCSGAGWEEWKTEDNLVALAEDKPYRYCSDQTGRWRCPPGEKLAEALGFYYHVRSSREINWIYQRNIEFLEDYFRADTQDVDSSVRDYIASLISNGTVVTLADLLRQSGGTAKPDDIFLLIARGVIWIDLASAALAEPDRVHVALSQPPSFAATMPAEAALPLSESNGNACSLIQELLANMGPNEIATANRRLKLIRAYQAGESISDGVPSRTIRHWARAVSPSRDLTQRRLCRARTAIPQIRESKEKASGKNAVFDEPRHRNRVRILEAETEISGLWCTRAYLRI